MLDTLLPHQIVRVRRVQAIEKSFRADNHLCEQLQGAISYRILCFGRCAAAVASDFARAKERGTQL